jgi:hypothetical protein
MQFKSDKFEEYRQKYPDMMVKDLVAIIVKDWIVLSAEEQKDYALR